ncbi:MAG TPA: alkane 1-monooxygenase, partial [Chitinophagales bacterium]
MNSFKFIKFFSPVVAISLMLFSIIAGGIFYFLPVIYSFIMIPALELFMEPRTDNMSKAEEEVAKNDIAYDILVWLIVPIQYIFVFVFAWKIKTTDLNVWETIGIISALGLSCGVFGINVAHELGHRNTWYEQAMSKSLLLTSLYMHFFIEHNRGHHKNVSTDEDPASARYGETLYAFWFRSIKDGWTDAWKLENSRLKKLGKSWITLQNEMLVYQLIQVVFVGLIAVFFGWKAMLCFIAAAVFGFLLLETVNYVEHYGLRRKK